jgi:hypothetical protein
MKTSKRLGTVLYGIFILAVVFPLFFSACGKKGDPIPPDEPGMTR